jgi:hypothetical protein
MEQAVLAEIERNNLTSAQFEQDQQEEEEAPQSEPSFLWFRRPKGPEPEIRSEQGLPLAQADQEQAWRQWHRPAFEQASEQQQQVLQQQHRTIRPKRRAR